MRADRTSAELLKYAETLERLSSQIKGVATAIHQAGLPSLLVHGDSAVNRYLPNLRKWAASLEVDCELQIQSFKKGEKAHAAKMKEDAATKAKKRPAK